jgi:DHA2 family multidrug resistance protein
MKRQILIITVIAAAVMELIDTSIVNVALSYMSGNLGATLEDTSWVITAYAIANVIIIPITSFLAAKLGRRNYYIGSVILFTLSSFLCGQATNIWMLVACRFMQGMGGGALLSVSAAFCLSFFIGWELKVQHPVVNLRVLKSRNLSVAALLTFVSGIGLFSSIYLTPIYAQRFLNFTPTGTGLLLLPGAILAIGGLLISARLLQRGLPPVIMITSGMFLFMLFTWQMSRLDLDAGPDNMYIPLIFRAIGLAIVTVPLSTLAVSSLEAKDIPQGTALNNMMRQLGGSFGIATVNTYLAHRNAIHRTDLVSHLSAGDPGVIQRLSGYTRFFADKGATGFDAERQALGLLDAGVFRQSNALSFGDAYLLLGVVFFIGLPFLLLTSIRKGKKPAIALADH